MTEPNVHGVATLFCGLGSKSLGVLRARGTSGSRFESVGAFDIDQAACEDFERLTGAKAQVVDLGEVKLKQFSAMCSRRPDAVIMSPPCKGLSGCLSESLSKTAKYQALNALALRAINLVLEAWAVPPALILLENVPRMLTRGADMLDRIKSLLRAAGYLVDLRTHDCGELGHLAQSRKRLLLVARHTGLAPSAMLMPPVRGLRPMSDVLWPLPVPLPGSALGGPLHRLPKLAAINWLRLASIRAGRDWRDIPAAIGLAGDVRLPQDERRHSGKYGVQSPSGPSRTVLADLRTGKGICDVADPRLAPRTSRQNGGFGVGAHNLPSHSVLGEATVRNTFVSVADARVEARLSHSPRRGSYQVQDPQDPSSVIRANHSIRQAPASVADDRLFHPTHHMTATSPLDSDRERWTTAYFTLHGPPVAAVRGGSPTHLIIEAPDGTVHRPLTTLELAVLQGLPAWHRPGDPTELQLGDEGGEWLQLEGSSDSAKRERIGNAVPVQTAQAFGQMALDVLDSGATETFRLGCAGIWVGPGPGHTGYRFGQAEGESHA